MSKCQSVKVSSIKVLPKAKSQKPKVALSLSLSLSLSDVTHSVNILLTN